jgi:proteasome accessory factor B
MQSVVERVLNLLIYLLQSTNPVTADDVRRTVPGYSHQGDDAFHRMFERDKDLLRRLGVPLQLHPMDAWEVDFGYIVDPDEYAIPDPKLSEQERVALSVAARMVRLGGGNAGLDGLLKLGGVERGVGLEPLGADLGPEAEVLGELFHAITERRSIEFAYKERLRRLNPYALAHRRGHWYLAGATREGDRVYRVDRVGKLKTGDEAGKFTRPRSFDIRAVVDSQPWEAGTDEQVTSTVEFDSDVAWWAARTLGRAAPDDGPFRVELPVANRDAFIGWVLSFGDSAEVLDPPELRDEIRSRVLAALGMIA